MVSVTQCTLINFSEIVPINTVEQLRAEFHPLNSDVTHLKKKNPVECFHASLLEKASETVGLQAEDDFILSTRDYEIRSRVRFEHSHVTTMAFAPALS